MINRNRFFDAVRKFFFKGKLSQAQVDGMSAILDEWEKRMLTDLRWLAYILATTYHETAQTMQPIEEYGRGRGKKYGLPVNGKVYFGRGFVQLTWSANYEKMSKIIFGDYRLLSDPDLALNMKVATQILFEGMLTGASAKGDFTGKSLEMYFNEIKDDPINARRIINGVRKGEILPDKAESIASYYKNFLAALK